MQRREITWRQQRWPERGQSLLRGLFLPLYVPVSVETTIHDHSRAHMELLPCPSHTNYQLQPIHLHGHGESGTWRNLLWFSYCVQQWMNYSTMCCCHLPERTKLFRYLLHLNGCPAYLISSVRKINQLFKSTHTNRHQTSSSWAEESAEPDSPQHHFLCWTEAVVAAKTFM